MELLEQLGVVRRYDSGHLREHVDQCERLTERSAEIESQFSIDTRKKSVKSTS
jgi:hypothetical protein